ncbi:hypothetical protein [Kitasatospora sp. NPDC004272]
MDSAPQATATDQPADGAPATPKCARDGCENRVPPSRTRPRAYCSRACRSKVDHAKAKAKKAAAAPAAPPPAPVPVPATTRPAAPASPVVSTWAADGERWGDDGQRLLGTADALRRKLTGYLLAIEAGTDPATAFKALAELLPSYSTRIYRTAQEIRDKARWPDADEDERVRRRLMERLDMWVDPDHDLRPDQDEDQGEQLDQDDVLEPDGQAAEHQPVQAPPAATALARPGPPALPRQQTAGPLEVPPEPYLRGLGRFDLIRNISVLVDQVGWDIAGWTRAPGLFYVRRAGRALAWAEHGLAGLPGWVVVIDGHLLTDATDRTRPKVAGSIDEAALLVRQAVKEGLIDPDSAPPRT